MAQMAQESRVKLGESENQAKIPEPLLRNQSEEQNIGKVKISYLGYHGNEQELILNTLDLVNKYPNLYKKFSENIIDYTKTMDRIKNDVSVRKLDITISDPYRVNVPAKHYRFDAVTERPEIIAELETIREQLKIKPLCLHLYVANIAEFSNEMLLSLLPYFMNENVTVRFYLFDSSSRRVFQLFKDIGVISDRTTFDKVNDLDASLSEKTEAPFTAFIGENNKEPYKIDINDIYKYAPDINFKGYIDAIRKLLKANANESQASIPQNAFDGITKEQIDAIFGVCVREHEGQCLINKLIDPEKLPVATTVTRMHLKALLEDQDLSTLPGTDLTSHVNAVKKYINTYSGVGQNESQKNVNDKLQKSTSDAVKLPVESQHSSSPPAYEEGASRKIRRNRRKLQQASESSPPLISESKAKPSLLSEAQSKSMAYLLLHDLKGPIIELLQKAGANRQLQVSKLVRTQSRLISNENARYDGVIVKRMEYEALYPRLERPMGGETLANTSSSIPPTIAEQHVLATKSLKKKFLPDEVGDGYSIRQTVEFVTLRKAKGERLTAAEEVANKNFEAPISYAKKLTEIFDLWAVIKFFPWQVWSAVQQEFVPAEKGEYTKHIKEIEDLVKQIANLEEYLDENHSKIKVLLETQAKSNTSYWNNFFFSRRHDNTKIFYDIAFRIFGMSARPNPNKDESNSVKQEQKAKVRVEGQEGLSSSEAAMNPLKKPKPTLSSTSGRREITFDVEVNTKTKVSGAGMFPSDDEFDPREGKKKEKKYKNDESSNESKSDSEKSGGSEYYSNDEKTSARRDDADDNTEDNAEESSGSEISLS